MSDVTDILAAVNRVLPAVRWLGDYETVRATVAGLEVYVADFRPAKMGLHCVAGEYRCSVDTPDAAADFVLRSLTAYREALNAVLPPAPSAVPTLFGEPHA